MNTTAAPREDLRHALPAAPLPEISPPPHVVPATEGDWGIADRNDAWRGGDAGAWPFETRWPVLMPVLALLAMSLVFRFTALDVTISRWFYDPATHTWPWFFAPPCTAFYRLGIYPPIGLVSVGGVMIALGWWLPTTSPVPRAGWFLVLLMLIGPGLIVNLGFKSHWGRARPHEIHEFDGRHDYSPVGSPGSMLNGNSSFPSGHAALAFYLMAPGFLVSRRRPRLMALLFACGAAYGLGMSATRVIQGGHFTSDVLWSGGIMYLTGVALALLLLRGKP